jgi:hypothetical protein
MVKTDIDGCQTDFILDTGEAISIVTTPTGWLTRDSITIIRATRNIKKYQLCKPRECMVGGHHVRHWFLYVPEALSPLLGRDLLSKLSTTVSMDLGLPDVSALLVLTLEVSPEKSGTYIPPGTINLSVLNHS